eukprot:TRINITY_DN1403_c0_g1_i7.p2 TRINITY_DN1403_c0_g1~~TRINITY_DN1403_c0_g1_i7.p2  ORF type:complete len:150 (+),score=61.29 TRINITY_DN1403_c0_g1_i7:1047-1496(+)
MAEIRRKIKIKTGSCNRLYKEMNSYTDEVEVEKQRLEKMKLKEDTEEGRLRQQREVIEESTMMIEDCKRRLETTYNDLIRLLDHHSDESDIADSSEAGAARTVIDLVAYLFNAKEAEEEEENEEDIYKSSSTTTTTTSSNGNDSDSSDY